MNIEKVKKLTYQKTYQKPKGYINYNSINNFKNYFITIKRNMIDYINFQSDKRIAKINIKKQAKRKNGKGYSRISVKNRSKTVDYLRNNGFEVDDFNGKYSFIDVRW